MLNFVVGQHLSFNWLVEISAKKYGCFSPKIGGKEKHCQNPFPVILKNPPKNQRAIKLGGGGLNARKGGPAIKICFKFF